MDAYIYDRESCPETDFALSIIYHITTAIMSREITMSPLRMSVMRDTQP